MVIFHYVLLATWPHLIFRAQHQRGSLLKILAYNVPARTVCVSCPGGVMYMYMLHSINRFSIYLLMAWRLIGTKTSTAIMMVMLLRPYHDFYNSLRPSDVYAIIWTKSVILLIEPWGTNFNKILIAISLRKIHLKMSSGKWRSFCPDLNVMICSPFFQYRRYHNQIAFNYIAVYSHLRHRHFETNN